MKSGESVQNLTFQDFFSIISNVHSHLAELSDHFQDSICGPAIGINIDPGLLPTHVYQQCGFTVQKSGIWTPIGNNKGNLTETLNRWTRLFEKLNTIRQVFFRDPEPVIIHPPTLPDTFAPPMQGFLEQILQIAEFIQFYSNKSMYWMGDYFAEGTLKSGWEWKQYYKLDWLYCSGNRFRIHLKRPPHYRWIQYIITQWRTAEYPSTPGGV
jgi:hypothetical protein